MATGDSRMDIDGSTHLVDPKNCKRTGLYNCYMNFYKIFLFQFLYVFLSFDYCIAY